MRLLITLSLLSILLATVPGCQYSHYYDYRKQYLKRVFFAGPIPDGHAIIFIHGTKESVVSKLVHKLDYPFGVVSAATLRTSSVLSRIGDTLYQADPEDFARDKFFFYGWHGKLNFPSRLRAARRLYDVIKQHNGPLTIITHSHGCGVALHLAECAQADPDCTLQIERLILLAPPVQVATKHLVHAPIFKEVYSFYSTADLIQIGDPQGLYWESYAYTPEHVKVPIFSKRTFDPAPNIMQVRMFLDRQSPGHLSFMLSRLIKHIPVMLKMVKERADHNGYQETRNLYSINIPPGGCPEFYTPQPFSPRTRGGRKMARDTTKKGTTA